MRRRVALLSLLSLLSLIVALVVAPVGATAAPVTKTVSARTSAVTSSSLGNFKPTFVGPAATGCVSAGCSLLTGPFPSPSTASVSSPSHIAADPAAEAASHHPHAMPLPVFPRSSGSDPVPPTVSCQPLGPGCDSISTSPGGAAGVNGLNAVDSGTLSTNVLLPRDIEPPDQGLCAGNGYVVEDNNIGEILIFNRALQRKSSVISLDTLMGLTAKGFSSGGDISCTYDYNNGGHWFFTQFVSTNPESSGGAFTGCFAGVARCLPRGDRGDDRAQARSVPTTSTSLTPITTRPSRAIPTCSMTSPRSQPPGTPSSCSTTSSRSTRPSHLASAAAFSTDRRNSRSTRGRSN